MPVKFLTIDRVADVYRRWQDCKGMVVSLEAPLWDDIEVCLLDLFRLRHDGKAAMIIPDEEAAKYRGYAEGFEEQMRRNYEALEESGRRWMKAQNEAELAPVTVTRGWDRSKEGKSKIQAAVERVTDEILTEFPEFLRMPEEAKQEILRRKRGLDPKGTLQSEMRDELAQYPTEPDPLEPPILEIKSPNS